MLNGFVLAVFSSGGEYEEDVAAFVDHMFCCHVNSGWRSALEKRWRKTWRMPWCLACKTCGMACQLHSVYSKHDFISKDDSSHLELSRFCMLWVESFARLAQTCKGLITLTDGHLVYLCLPSLASCCGKQGTTTRWIWLYIVYWYIHIYLYKYIYLYIQDTQALIPTTHDQLPGEPVLHMWPLTLRDSWSRLSKTCNHDERWKRCSGEAGSGL